MENQNAVVKNGKVNHWTALLTMILGFIIGFFLRKKDTSVSIDINNLVISPIDSDLAYSESQFDALLYKVNGEPTNISPHFLLYSLLTCQVIRHVKYFVRDYTRLKASGVPEHAIHHRSAGFKRFFDYIKYSNHFNTPVGAEGSITYSTTSGSVFISNFSSIIEPSIVNGSSAYRTYKRRNSMSDRINDVLAYVSMYRGLLVNPLIWKFHNDNFGGTGVSLNSLKKFDQDFRPLIAMSPIERKTLDTIIASGVTIIHNPKHGEFQLSCGITKEDLNSVLIANIA